MDRRAKALRISRNQLVVRALEREVRDSSEWSPGFFERLCERDRATVDAVDELKREVRNASRSKPPPRL